MTTAAALVAAEDKTFRLEEIELGDPGTDDVLVEIGASGVCHTDLDLLNLGFRHVMGHEGAGVVVACGERVGHVAPGDRVVLNWAIPCGECFQCRRGFLNICEHRARVRPESRTLDGKPVIPSFGVATLATHTLVPRQAVVKMDIDIPFPSASLLGCGVTTGFGSVVNVAKVEPGSSVVVLGAGGVGLSVIQGARHAAAGMVVAIDINAGRLELARQFGATHTIVANAEDEGLLDAANEVKALVGRGADYAFECTAVASLAAAPLAMICNGGMAIAVSGFEEVVPVDMRLFEFDKVYVNPLYGGCNPEVDFPKLLSLYDSGALKLDEMVTRTYPLSVDGLAEAFEDMRSGRNAKGVIVPRS